MQFLINNFWALTITGLTLGAVYALVALGYTLVYGVLRLINFAHSEVFMYGTFAALWVVMFFGRKPGPGHLLGGHDVRRGHGDVGSDRRAAGALRLPPAA